MTTQYNIKPCPCPGPIENHPSCYQCGKLMCQQTPGSFCADCSFKELEVKVTRNKYGQIIDPRTQKALKTCYCGKLMTSAFNPCIMSARQDKELNHYPIQPGKTFEEVKTEIMSKKTSK